ncbi:MAG: hypothetical protein KKE37_07955 [Verrucomicrobia bacterium]|nr:hypothetical protein [Verrucomicrobiota bacterium]MBU4291212.1 hypothetical protein [Verrucomicrobiota bacterium]MBU4429270.1 hypothetical protein [Verrucomicrobiota bacterium]MCG2678613.1 hypothetical protein [Kiritimatiellia bacterium]
MRLRVQEGRAQATVLFNVMPAEVEQDAQGQAGTIGKQWQGGHTGGPFARCRQGSTV